MYISRLLDADPKIDSVVLGCTHYPLLINKIRQYMPAGIRIIEQGDIVAASLSDYLQRHPRMESRLTRGGTVEYLTTENPEKFNDLAALFMQSEVNASRL